MDWMKQVRRVVAVVALGTAAQMAAVAWFRRQRRRYAGERRHILVTQGGVWLRPTADEIHDTVVSVMMGGLTVDLRSAGARSGPIHLDAFVLMGGLEVIVPKDWHVRVEAVQVAMGGAIDERDGLGDAGRPADLVLTGRVVMGGLQVLDEPRMPRAVHRFVPGARSATRGAASSSPA
jgi:hypothetical protein